MAKFKFTDNQREVAKKAAFRNYQRDLLDAYLFGATDEEKTDIIGKFNADTKDGAYLIINGTDSKVNENGQLITTDKDGNIEVWAGAYVFASLTWKTDKDGNTTETRDFFRAPISCDTWVRAERVVNYWIDYAERQYAGVIEEIGKRREKVDADCKSLVSAASALLEYTDNLPQKFVEKNRTIYSTGVRFGYKFPEEIVSAFQSDKD